MEMMDRSRTQVEVGLAVVICGGRILLARRDARLHQGGVWEFPGGKVGEGETPADCAVREAREELGIACVPYGALPVVEYAYPDRTVRLHPILCRPLEGDPERSGVPCVWCKPEELAEYPMPAANAPIVAVLRATLKGGECDALNGSR
jgi:8-oxo-dGTP diphosphatase